MIWLFYSLATVVLYSVHDILVKNLSEGVNATTASIIINGSASLALLFLSLLFYFLSPNRKSLFELGIVNFGWLCLAGVCLGIATVTLMTAFNKGGSFSIVIPIVYVGIILVSALVGNFYFKESLSVKQVAGLFISLVGMIFLLQK